MAGYKKTWRGLQKSRIKKEDTNAMLPVVAPLVIDACYKLWTDGVIEEFSDTDYIEYVCVEILHGERWRRVAKIHNIDDAIEEVKYVHEKFRPVYLDRLQETESNYEPVVPKVERKIIKSGVNFNIYGK